MIFFTFCDFLQYISLDGDSLGTDDLMRLANGELKIKLTKEAINRVTKARNLLEGIVDENKSMLYAIMLQMLNRIKFKYYK